MTSEDLHREAVEKGQHYYIDPVTSRKILTHAFLLERGYCCESGCRHCPYGFVGCDMYLMRLGGRE